MTTAASVACGISPMSGAMAFLVTSVVPAVTISSSWVRAPEAVDRGLAGSAAAGHGPQQRAARIRESRRQQLLVRSDRRLLARREPAPDGDRLGEAHQRNTQGAGPELCG